MPGGTNERRASSERDEQTALTDYLGALVVRTEAAMRPRPAASVRLRGRQRRIRRRVALGVAAAIVIVASVLGVLSADIDGTSRGGPATTEPLNPRQLPREVAPWKLTNTDRSHLGSLEFPTTIYCEKGRQLLRVPNARKFHYTSSTSSTASFIEIVIRLDDKAEAIGVVRDLESLTAECPGTSRTDDLPDPLRGTDPGASVSRWYQTRGEIATLTAIARRDSTIAVLVYTADVRWQPQLPPNLVDAALARSRPEN
ncbi:hypothetical protein ACFRCG_29195 [Embleya sp. NPDC056575]|uniref:hypothetical protein n=1 Tax=unclassified Embleya TaxID=2699296 RepID=UPI003693E6B4